MLKNVAPIAVKREVACAATTPACYGQRETFNFDQSTVLEHDRSDQPELPLDNFDGLGRPPTSAAASSKVGS